MITISGSPIGGENPPNERRWRERVASACAGLPSCSSVALTFRLEPQRKVDLDNLIRPALAGLRDAGIFTRGYRNLDQLAASKQSGDTPGLDIVLNPGGLSEHVDHPGPVLLRAATSVMPRDGDRQSKAAWRDTVADALEGDVRVTDCWVVIDTTTTSSLEAVMKPVIDGLEPLLGRDPRGRLEFVPNDDRIVHLAVRRRQPGGPTLDVTVGAISDG